MESKIIRAEEVAKELDVSVPYAYKIIRKLNDELKAKGYITVAGRVNRQYFNERLYGAERNDENLKFAEEMMDKPVSYYAFQMLYWTGIREGELLALTPADFDFEKGTVRINKT